jgi:hypothetical protein
VSNHTPPIPPNMPIINIKNSINVREFVGNISDAIKLADDPAGDVKKNIMQINIYSHIKESIY